LPYGTFTATTFGERTTTAKHNRFNRAISKHHPNKAGIRAIEQEQAATELLDQQLIAGRPGRRTKKAYRSLEKRLAALKGRYDSGQMSAIEYTIGVSHNLAKRKKS